MAPRNTRNECIYIVLLALDGTETVDAKVYHLFYELSMLYHTLYKPRQAGPAKLKFQPEQTSNLHFWDAFLSPCHIAAMPLHNRICWTHHLHPVPSLSMWGDAHLPTFLFEQGLRDKRGFKWISRENEKGLFSWMATEWERKQEWGETEQWEAVI